MKQNVICWVTSPTGTYGALRLPLRADARTGPIWLEKVGETESTSCLTVWSVRPPHLSGMGQDTLELTLAATTHPSNDRTIGILEAACRVIVREGGPLHRGGGLPRRAPDRGAECDRCRRDRRTAGEGARRRVLDAEHAVGTRRPRSLDARPGRARGRVGQGDERARVRGRRSRPAGTPGAAHAGAGRAVRDADRAGRVPGGLGTDRTERGIRPRGARRNR